MKKWLIVAGSIIVVWLMIVGTFLFVKDDSPGQLKILKRDIKILRVVAEHRELQWKIKEYERRLNLKPNPAPQSSATQKPVITPVPSNADVFIKAK